MNRLMAFFALLLLGGIAWMMLAPPRSLTVLPPQEPLPTIIVTIEEGVVIVKGEKFTGAIFNEAVSKKDRWVSSDLPRTTDIDFWTPSSTDLARVERCLQRTMLQLLSDPGRKIPKRFGKYEPGLNSDTRHVATQLSKFCRQYVGCIIDGQHYILLNCFPRDEPFMAGWRHGFAMVADGGADFWRILYNVELDRSEDFDCNGSA
jgi:hypothetical protein